jgi:DNA repair exonuclease SbcCD nuclease subunit
MRPYGLIADLHLHQWSAFAATGEDGVNSRLKLLLSEIKRCADKVRELDGDTIVIAGDVFHVRGQIAPSVLNPAMDTFKWLIECDFKITVLAGNHDLEGRESNRIGSAVTALEGIGCMVVNEEEGWRINGKALLPWIDNIGKLKAAIESMVKRIEDSGDKVGDSDLILHAPIDDTIVGLPAHGLTADWLAKQGFRRVFAGHYHNHKDFGNGVWSIGALAHHTWSDIGSKAGFLIVVDDGVKWFKSHAPEFVEINAGTDMDDIPLLVDGNYVRAKINSTKQKDVEELRDYLNGCGAKGVVILAQKEASAAPREGASTIKAGASLEVSVTDFIKAQGYGRADKLAVLCQNILTDVRRAA